MNGLMVEPGGYCPRKARLLSGVSGELFNSSQVSVSMPSMNRAGVITGLADEGQHFAVGGIDCHQCAAIIAESLLRHFLQFCIQRQHQVAAGLRCGARQHAHGAPAGIHLDLLEPGLAVQVFFIALLDAGLADVVGTEIIGSRLILFQLIDVLLVDAADIADKVRGHIGKGIFPEQSRLDLHAGKTKLLRGNARHFFVAQAG